MIWTIEEESALESLFDAIETVEATIPYSHPYRQKIIRILARLKDGIVKIENTADCYAGEDYDDLPQQLKDLITPSRHQQRPPSATVELLKAVADPANYNDPERPHFFGGK